MDPTAKLLPWFEDQLAPIIHDPEDVPENLQRLRKYADRMWIPELAQGQRSRDFWTSVHISSSKDMQTIRANLKWKHDVYHRPLQCTQTATIGFGLYSARFMDTEHLSKCVSQKCGFQVYCKWRVVHVENHRNLSESEKTRAIHFEVAAVNEARAKKRLPNIYAHTNKESSAFPAGYRLRFVFTLANMPSSSKVLFSALVNRQHTFIGMVTNKEVHYTGPSIDYKHADLPFTIRQILDQASPPDDSSNLTFLGVKHEHHKLKVSFLTSNTDRALELVTNVVPYTRFIMRSLTPGTPDGAFDQAFGTLFSSDMLQAAEGIHWDPTRDGVVSEFDAYLEETLHQPDFFDFEGMEPPLAQLRPNIDSTDPTQAHIRDLAQGRGVDSIAQPSVWSDTDDLSAIAPDDGTEYTTQTLQSLQLSLATQMETSLNDRMNQLQTAMMQQITTSIAAALANPVQATNASPTPMDTGPDSPPIEHPGALLQNPAGGGNSGTGT